MIQEKKLSSIYIASFVIETRRAHRIVDTIAASSAPLHVRHVTSMSIRIQEINNTKFA